jgi:hypothetical protein
VLYIDDKQQQSWKVDTSEDAERRWKDVAEVALYGKRTPFAPKREENDDWRAVEAVMFVEPVNGQHTCKPCKASERPAAEYYPSNVARITEILDEARTRMSSAEIAEQSGR